MPAVNFLGPLPAGGEALAGDPGERTWMGAHGRERVARCFDADASAAAVWSLLADVAAAS
jgi:hypothetical protein